jgi:hexosaminidase
MPRRNFFATCLFSAALLPVPTRCAGAQPLDVMPAPFEARVLAGRVAVGGPLEAAATGASGPRLASAIARAAARWAARVGPAGPSPAPFRLQVSCAGLAPEVPAGGEDESYVLVVGGSGAMLSSPTDIGALRGLETLLQMLQVGAGGASLPVAEVRDHPRFPWRGLMIDVSRHWQPAGAIERNIDAMAAVKLNVLHLHLTDDQGFRIESLTHPELQGLGSDGRYFTQAEMRSLIAYAALRGIRVVPEFDIPGHATSWVVSHPELASLPGPYSVERWWGVFNPVLDPTNERTYALLADFLGEMADLFPDRYMHIGGDENNGVQWNANPSIQAFIRTHGLGDDAGLHAAFNRRIGAILAGHGKRLVGWDEILAPALPEGSVIDSWRGPEGVGKATALGYDCILSNGYYIDLCDPASDHYATDPAPAGSALSPEARAHVLGGEATMWSEWVTPETIDSRIWPRTAAIAERLWSPGDVRDTAEMYRRLAIVSARLTEAGSLHERNRDLMLRHLVGANLSAPGVDSLRTVIALLEPVKHYDRGGQQVWGNQLTPLTGIADAAMPESDLSRDFSVRVERLLFGGGTPDPAEIAALGSLLERWSACAVEVSERMPGSYPALREAVPSCRALADACAVGREALRMLGGPAAAEPGQLARQMAVLDRAGEPNLSATLVPILKPVRLLAVAAARWGARTAPSLGAWTAAVRTEAFPAPADKGPD